MISRLPLFLALSFVLVIVVTSLLTGPREALIDETGRGENKAPAGEKEGPGGEVPEALRGGGLRLSEVDARHLASFQAKKRARDLVHVYNSALRFGSAELVGVTRPGEVLQKLTRGVAGPGEIVFQFQELSPDEAERMLSFLHHDGRRIIPTAAAEYTEDEERIWKHLTDCRNGNCSACFDLR